jgi:hypothetical protein
MTIESDNEIFTFAEHLANRLIQSQGYFVIACNVPEKMGEVLREVPFMRHPVVVVGSSTKKEFARQQRIGAKRYPSVFRTLDGYEYYYRVTAE